MAKKLESRRVNLDVIRDRFANHHNSQQYDIDSLDVDFEKRKASITCRKCGNVWNPFFHNIKKQDCRCIRSEKTKRTVIDRYGVEHISQSEEVKNRKENTCLVNYGVRSPLQSHEIMDKRKQTCIDRYGVEHPFMNEDIHRKSMSCRSDGWWVKVNDAAKKEMLRKYGVDSPMKVPYIREKVFSTNLSRYGHISPLANVDVRQKGIETSTQRYGYDYPSQNPDVYYRSIQNRRGWKSFIFPGGEIVRCQGYEPIALEYLVECGYAYEDIEMRHMIRYHDIEGKERSYFPDIFIPKENRIIEVKSSWTYEQNWIENQLKQNKSVEDGYSFEFWVIEGK